MAQASQFRFLPLPIAIDGLPIGAASARRAQTGRARKAFSYGGPRVRTLLPPAKSRANSSTDVEATHIAVVVLWAVSGPVFDWSDIWQLVINTGTTIVTFLMVFVIQNTQSRDTQAMQLKRIPTVRAVLRSAG
jgi:hypothetical protein